VVGEPPEMPGVPVLRTHQPGNPLASEQACWLLGVAGQDDVAGVQTLIRTVNPQVVLIDLCASRTDVLRRQGTEAPTLGSMVSAFREGTTPTAHIAWGWLCARLAGPAATMAAAAALHAAVTEAGQCGAAIAFGERPLQITLMRSWAALGNPWQRAKFLGVALGAGIAAPVEKQPLKLQHKAADRAADSDPLTQGLQELCREFPQLKGPLMEERAQYTVAVMRSLATSATRVVAVVAAGRLPGIRANWDADIDLPAITASPPPRHTMRLYLWGAVTVGVTAGVVLSWRKQ